MPERMQWACLAWYRYKLAWVWNHWEPEKEVYCVGVQSSVFHYWQKSDWKMRLKSAATVDNRIPNGAGLLATGSTSWLQEETHRPRPLEWAPVGAHRRPNWNQCLCSQAASPTGWEGENEGLWQSQEFWTETQSHGPTGVEITLIANYILGTLTVKYQKSTSSF